jgi:uncharacterized protein YjbI with pentapeptide repeats
MANEEHIRLIKSGVSKWNEWRDKQTNFWVDLSQANLTKANLTKADLKQAVKFDANLNEACLKGADLLMPR